MQSATERGAELQTEIFTPKYCVMNYYRNNITLLSYQGVEVDEASLWLRNGELMVLVDDDQYVTYPFSEEKFYKVKID